MIDDDLFIDIVHLQQEHGGSPEGSRLVARLLKERLSEDELHSFIHSFKEIHDL